MNWREETSDNYRQRIGRAIEQAHKAIAQGLDEAVTPASLARTANFSPHHFSRIFSAVVGESVSQFIRRLRLERAARDLVDSGDQIIQIAMRAGYSAHGPFTRAFRAHFDQSPTEYRASPTHPSILRPAPSGIYFDRPVASVAAALASDGWSIAPISVRDLGVTTLAGRPLAGGYEAVPAAVHDLMSRADDLSLEIDCEIIGIVRNDLPMDAVGMHLCFRDGMPRQVLELLDTPNRFERAGGKYAVGIFPGPYTSLDEAYAWMYQVWPGRSGHRIDGRPPFEVYLNDPTEVKPAEILTAIYMPVADSIPASPADR